MSSDIPTVSSLFTGKGQDGKAHLAVNSADNIAILATNLSKR